MELAFDFGTNRACFCVYTNNLFNSGRRNRNMNT
jgi:hypothetical protein